MTGMLPRDAHTDRYLTQIRWFPLLDESAEQDLARRYRDDGDKAAGDRLITSHLRLAAKIAGDYRGYGLPLSDLISEGNLGLVQALQRFDPDREVRFATYAIWWIRAAIQAYVVRSRSLVRMGTTAAQKKLFFNLSRMKAKLGATEGGDLSDDDVARIATELCVPAIEVIQMNRRLSAFDASLHMPIGEDGADWQENIADERDDQEIELANREADAARRHSMRRALAQLEPRERAIVEARYLRDDPPTLASLAERHRVSPERIRQIEISALAKMKRLMRPAATPTAEAA